MYITAYSQITFTHLLFLFQKISQLYKKQETALHLHSNNIQRVCQKLLLTNRMPNNNVFQSISNCNDRCHKLIRNIFQALSTVQPTTLKLTSLRFTTLPSACMNAYILRQYTEHFDSYYVSKVKLGANLLGPTSVLVTVTKSSTVRHVMR